eukprot:CAMPEP_0179162486 /NCGR_PEP_ID=MMETSP0796-20121207/79604_1 /TAXON_ID=73915 /ORGANISM="Pyrodinium bahamense, Strain pbaha01" /LENGTH=50 /DNA_ID=CAMNT_0020864697 /DNA_START=137 /DNA_END=287 /DNA_ORIENTATION=-
MAVSPNQPVEDSHFGDRRQLKALCETDKQAHLVQGKLQRGAGRQRDNRQS